MQQQRIRSESGQVIPLVVLVALVGLLGIAALAIDVGAWLGASRKAQGAADAAALAAAQDLPASTSTAASNAAAYATRNGVTLDGAVRFGGVAQPNDTVTVAVKQPAPVFFARILGIESVTVGGRATAQAVGASSVPGVPRTPSGDGKPIPFAVSAAKVPPACGCSYGEQVSLYFGPAYAVASGQFGLVDIVPGSTGNASPPTIGGWIANGVDATLPVGSYAGITGNKMMSSQVRNPLQTLANSGRIVLLPVYSGLSGGVYTVVGWAAFRLTGYGPAGNVTTFTGSFVRFKLPVSGPPAQYFGVGKVKLTG